MRDSIRSLWCALIVGVVGTILAGPAAAGISVLSQARSLQLSGKNLGQDIFSPQSLDAAPDVPFDDALQSPNFGAMVTVSQSSTFTASAKDLNVSASGSFSGGTVEDVTVSGFSTFSLMFRLDAPANYHITSQSFAVDALTGSSAVIALQPVGADSPVFQTDTRGIFHGPPPDLDQGGVLSPGTYMLSARVDGLNANDFATPVTEFRMNFSATAIDQPPLAVPLPPGAWTGLFSLALAAVWRWRHLNRAISL